jgi:hypothetical protein
MLALLAAACGPAQGIDPAKVSAAAQPVALAARPLAECVVLEASGAQPEDTSLRVPSGSPACWWCAVGAGLRHLRAAAISREHAHRADRGRRGRGHDQSTPHVYGLDLVVAGALGDGATITFSYGAHFVAPAGARQRYGSNLAFEKVLAIGRLEENGQVVFLPTSRPASDILSAPLPGPGRYLVAAPR